MESSFGASLIAQLVNNPPAMQETPVRSLGWEDPLENGTATHIPRCDLCTDIHQDILAIAEKWRQLGCPLLVKDYVKYSALIS